MLTIEAFMMYYIHITVHWKYDVHGIYRDRV
jgi:hypothetical protein